MASRSGKVAGMGKEVKAGWVACDVWLTKVEVKLGGEVRLA